MDVHPLGQAGFSCPGTQQPSIWEGNIDAPVGQADPAGRGLDAVRTAADADTCHSSHMETSSHTRKVGQMASLLI